MVLEQARKVIVNLKKATGAQVSERDVTPAGPGDGPRWLSYVAVVTGIFAAFGAFLLARGNTLANDAVYQGGQAVLFQAQSSDAWNEYQAVSIKARVLETALATAPSLPEATRAELTAQDRAYRDRQPALQAEARRLAGARDRALALSARSVGDKGALTTAGVLVQAGIALASVAALTRRRAALYAAGLCGLVAVGFALPALVHSVPFLPR